jgi:tetratricopeptide (TPR) repeat protein
MKRTLFVISLLVFAGLISAQQPAEYIIRAKACMDHGRPRDAISLLSEFLLKNQDYRIYLERGDAFIANRDFISAASDYQTASSLQLASGEYGLARISALKNDPAGSLLHLEKSMNSIFKKSEKTILLDSSFSLIENTSAWRLFWKKERYSVPERKVSEIEYYISIGKKEDAVAALNEIQSDYGQDSYVQYAKAMVDLALGKVGDCISALSKLLETDKNNEIYLRLLAKAQSASGNHAGASESYSEMISAGVADADLYILRGACYNKTGELNKAIADVSKFLEFYPDDKDALSFAGKLVAQSGDNLKAIDFFSRNLKLHPNDPECYIDRANSYFVSRTWDYAITDYTMALDIQPYNSETWLNKGIALLNSGKTEDACHDFRNALSLGNKKAASFISRNCIK